MKDKIIEEINKANKILILAHEKPDGDAVGSSFAMYHILKNINKDVDISLLEVPTQYNYLKDFKEINDLPSKKYDLCIVLDCASKERIAIRDYLLPDIIINIDHHHTNSNYGIVNYIESDYSSCAEVLYYLFKDTYEINQTIGECLLTGVLTDTGGFSNDNVSTKTLDMVKELINLGVDFHKVFYNAISKQSKEQFELFNIARERLVFYNNGTIAYTYITKEDTERLNCVPGDHEGIVDIGRNIDGVEVSVFIHEDDGYRVSLRSNGKVDVSKIASLFNGGGHKMAAGCILTGNFKETKEELIDEIIKRVNE